jgi:hypothetical protein
MYLFSPSKDSMGVIDKGSLYFKNINFSQFYWNQLTLEYLDTEIKLY